MGLFRSLEGLNSSGRLLGFIPTNPGTYKPPGFRAMSISVNKFNRGNIFRFCNLGLSFFLSPGASHPSFWTSDSDSPCRNPPQGHLLRSGNLNFAKTHFYNFSKCLVSNILGFSGFPRFLKGFNSSGRLVGFISTDNFR